MNRTEDEMEWERRFRQLSQLPPAQPNPYFYTRLEGRLASRLESAEAGSVLPWWLQRPAYALGTLGVLVALNVAVAFWGHDKSETKPTPGTYEYFVQEYQLDPSTAFANADE